MELGVYFEDIPSLLYILLGCLILGIIICRFIYTKSKRYKSRFISDTHWSPIEPVSDMFSWNSEAPHKYRPFKSTYHLTMSVTRTNRQEWLKLDDQYIQAIENHKRIMSEHPNSTIMSRASPENDMAIHEMYDIVIDTLTQRFPKYFVRQGPVVENTILGNKIPGYSNPSMSSQECLRLLACNIEEDVFVLRYDPDVEEYRLEATTGLAGLGFKWRNKIGLKLTDIHDPVPQYHERLKMSMNRYFHKIIPGNFTQRVTYGIMLGDKEDLFSSGNAVTGLNDVDSLDFANSVFVRLERQVLFRLPISGFLGFSIRTYMYSLAELKDEQLGDACADALEAWPDDTAEYKGRHVWGPAIISYLRS